MGERARVRWRMVAALAQGVTSERERERRREALLCFLRWIEQQRCKLQKEARAVYTNGASKEVLTLTPHPAPSL